MAVKLRPCITCPKWIKISVLHHSFTLHIFIWSNQKKMKTLNQFSNIYVQIRSKQKTNKQIYWRNFVCRHTTKRAIFIEIVNVFIKNASHSFISLQLKMHLLVNLVFEWILLSFDWHHPNGDFNCKFSIKQLL